MRFRNLMVAVLLAMVFVIAIVGCDGQNDDKQEKTMLTWAAAESSGTWYPIAARIISEIEKSDPNTKISLVSGGGHQNAIDVGLKNIELGWGYSADTLGAYNGIPPYDKEYPEIRHIATMFKLPLMIVVRADSDIYSWDDLYNKRFAVGPPAYCSHSLVKLILEAHDMSFETIQQEGGRVDVSPSSNAVDLFMDNQLDATAFFTTPDSGPMKVYETLPGSIRFVGIENQEAWQRLRQEHPEYASITIKAGAAGWEKHTKDIQTLAGVVHVFTHKDISEDLVYQVAKTIWETKDQWISVSSACKDANIQEALDGVDYPVHPGALRYYEEQGLDVSKFK